MITQTKINSKSRKTKKKIRAKKEHGWHNLMVLQRGVCENKKNIKFHRTYFPAQTQHVHKSLYTVPE